MREGVARPQIELLSRLVPKSYFEERIIYGRGIFWIGFRLGGGGMSHPQAATSLWACTRRVILLFRHSAKLIED
jgi:hypothetical protein